MTILDTDMEAITRNIWSTLFDLPLDLPVDPSAPSPLSGSATVTGIVHVEGAWQGAATLQCPLVLANTLTDALFQSEDGPDAEEIRDAIGELTNMLTGNIKALLPEPCQLSLPMVVFGSDYELDVLGTTLIASVTFVCETQPLVVTLMRRTDAGARS